MDDTVTDKLSGDLNDTNDSEENTSSSNTSSAIKHLETIPRHDHGKNETLSVSDATMSIDKDEGSVSNDSVEKDTEDGDAGVSFGEGFRKSVDADRPEEDIARGAGVSTEPVSVNVGTVKKQSETEKCIPGDESEVTEKTVGDSQETVEKDRSGDECVPDVTIDAKKYGGERKENPKEKSSPNTDKVKDDFPSYVDGLESNSTLNDRDSSDPVQTEETRDKTEFVQVNSKSAKISSTDMSDVQDESMESRSTTDEDPIGGTENTDFDASNDGETITGDRVAGADIDPSKGSDEEMCIIPDTEREISQAEKDAATALVPIGKEKDSDESSKEKSSAKIGSNAKKGSDSSKATVSAEARERKEDKISSRVKGSDNNHKSERGIKVANVCSIGFGKQKEPKDLTLHTLEVKTDKNCIQCCSVQLCQYQFSFDNKDRYICRESCLSAYREAHPGTNIKINRPNVRFSQPRTRSTRSKVEIKEPIPFVRKCSECKKTIGGDERNLTWECMEYCNEDCLATYQNSIGSSCANCKNNVPLTSLGKYCVRFGSDIRQFCSSGCLEEFKKGLKVCSYCQKDISGGYEGFLAPVGDKGQFKDFCTQVCMEKYDKMSNNRGNVEEIGECDVCNIVKAIHVEVLTDDKCIKLCSEPCFVAYKFANNINPVRCDTCHKYYEEVTHEHAFHSDQTHHFCSKTCRNVFIMANRKIVPCQWCKVKKYNYDMIKRTLNNGNVLMVCSINCFALYQVSVNAVSSRKIKCDECGTMHLAQFHLTMSDGTIRNFCSYKCVMLFQNQFSKNPITIASVIPEKPTAPLKTPDIPVGQAKRTYTRQTRSSTANIERSTTAAQTSMPVITGVHSLAQQTNGPSTSTRSSTQKAQHTATAYTPEPVPSPAVMPPPPPPQVKNNFIQQVIMVPPQPPKLKNRMTMCKPNTHTKGVLFRAHACYKETQTDDSIAKTVIVPVPVPIYVPSPMSMFSMPFPVPVPFPLPVPIPIFIPTTRNSANGIMKEIKKIQVKIPTDPFEAEILMMAEMVAGEKKVDNTDSESDEDDAVASPGGDGGFSPEAVDTSNTFGDDMLQMALKMATELDEPAVDLEGALTANTITASQSHESGTEGEVDETQQLHHHSMMENRGAGTRGGRKRPSRQRPVGPGQPNKRSRRMSGQDMTMMPPPQPQAPAPPPEPVEKPDANMCLKYTFGVNAWKQWVTTKNAELEKSTRRVKPFKSEILQLTADELNYSLCLFVKEVRKPNGSEYAPDTIYYLCLGIQQYLFENGRIDNIFTDPYYEKFTECLDEVARKFSVLYNDSHYIVTRVEEEHLWESKQLGAHSPHVLLSTLMFFNTKHFNLTTVDEHMQLSFSHIMKHWKRNPNQPGAAKTPGSRNVLLRFYPPQSALTGDTTDVARKKKVYEQQENEENPLRCPVKLYEFYLSKCPESVKTRNDVFYLLPERSCVPDSPVWYSTMALGRNALEKMLHRVKMVKEINVALLTS